MGSLGSLLLSTRRTMGRVANVGVLLLLVSSLLDPASSAPLITITSGVTLASLPLQALVVGKLLLLKKLLLEGVVLDKFLTTRSDRGGPEPRG